MSTAEEFLTRLENTLLIFFKKNKYRFYKSDENLFVSLCESFFRLFHKPSVKDKKDNYWMLQPLLHKSILVQPESAIGELKTEILYERDMLSMLKTLSIIISIVEFTMGIFGNGFIVLINGKDWVRKRKSSLIDFILICLAISRICFLCSTLSAITFKLEYGKLFFSKRILMSFSIIWTGSNYFCTASSTCLTVFYFFKIATFSNPIFLWMKQRMQVVLLIIVLGSVLCFCVSLIFIDTFTNMSIQYWGEMEQNFTFYYTKTVHDCLIYFSLLHMALIMCFLVSLSSFLLLVFSLWKHTKRMKLQNMCSKDWSMEAHVRAMKAMISSLILFIMHYFSNVMIMLSYTILYSVEAKIFAHVLIFLYPSGHPFLLILWNSKLKQVALSVLRKLKCVREEIIPLSQE